MEILPRNRRAGIAKMMTLDRDVMVLIPYLVEGRRALGRLVSELIRAEVTRREERAKRAAEGQPPWAAHE